MVFSQPCSQPPLFTLHSFISDRKKGKPLLWLQAPFFPNTFTLVCFLAEHLSKLCSSCYVQLLPPLTSAVGQSIHGVAFVAQTLKTTGGVHTCVITCPLKKTLIYICNQNQADDIIVGQSVAIFIRRDFPPTDTCSHLILNFPTQWKVLCTAHYVRLNSIGFW